MEKLYDLAPVISNKFLKSWRLNHGDSYLGCLHNYFPERGED